MRDTGAGPGGKRGHYRTCTVVALWPNQAKRVSGAWEWVWGWAHTPGGGAWGAGRDRARPRADSTLRSQQSLSAPPLRAPQPQSTTSMRQAVHMASSTFALVHVETHRDQASGWRACASHAVGGESVDTPIDLLINQKLLPQKRDTQQCVCSRARMLRQYTSNRPELASHMAQRLSRSSCTSKSSDASRLGFLTIDSSARSSMKLSGLGPRLIASS